MIQSDRPCVYDLEHSVAAHPIREHGVRAADIAVRALVTRLNPPTDDEVCFLLDFLDVVIPTLPTEMQYKLKNSQTRTSKTPGRKPNAST